MPGVVNCFSCALDANASVNWQITMDGNLVYIPTSSYLDAENYSNFLIIAMPDNYVLPGTAGRRTIACTRSTDSQTLEARLASPSMTLNSYSGYF